MYVTKVIPQCLKGAEPKSVNSLAKPLSTGSPQSVLSLLISTQSLMTDISHLIKVHHFYILLLPL